MKKNKKILFISSTGGHFDELSQLSPLFESNTSYIITEKTKHQHNSLRQKYGKRSGFLIRGAREKGLPLYLLILFLNCCISLYYFCKFRPNFIVTTGVHNAGPMCCIGKLFGKKIIYIETFANSKSKTATGKIIYHFADLFVVQWEEMLKLYPKAECWGWIY